MKKLFKIVLVSIIPLVLFSCYYDEFPEEIVQDDVVIDPDTVVSFADDIAPIFATYNCTQCHDASGQAPDLTPGSAYASLFAGYVNPGNSSSSTLYIQLNDLGHQNVDANSIALIAKWIDDGAENN